MVGKPKGIVRGRPMDADEEAAYVREVASQKTAALRMSLDAVERQGMPFRGETGGVGAGQGMGEVPPRPRPPAPDAAPRRCPVPDPATATTTATRSPTLASSRSIPLDPDLQARLDAARKAVRRARGPRRAPGAATGAPPAVTAPAPRPRTPAVGGTRDVPVPDPIARDYLLLALRLDQHVPGTVDGYFGPADLKAQVDLEQLRPPGAPRRGRGRPPRPAAGGGRGARPPPLARPPAHRARGARPVPRRRGRSRTSSS